MRTGFFRLCAMLIMVIGLAGLTGCEDSNRVFDFPSDDAGDDGGDDDNNGGGAVGGAADIDVTSSTPASGNTNISGSSLTVQTTSDTLNGVPVTRVQLDATSDGHARRVLVYFETATGAPQAVSYFWGAAVVTENTVYCPAAGCTGVSVNMATKEISFSNTALDNNSPVAPTDRYATLSLGIIVYP